MKRTKILSNILFWATIVSPLLSFNIASLIGEPDIFEVYGIIRYSWIMLLFVPIGLICFIWHLIMKKHKQKYKKNFIASLICTPILIIFGLYRFIYTNVTYDTHIVFAIQERTKIELPNNIKIASCKFDSYSLSYAKITDDETRIAFEYSISINELWKQNLNPSVIVSLPKSFQFELDIYNYFVFYDISNNKYNIDLEFDKIDFVFAAYSSKFQKIAIIENFTESK